MFAFAAVPIQNRSVQGAAAADARIKLLSAAESCLGLPYRYAGHDRRGLDCSGLVFLSFRESLNITVPRTAANLHAWTEKIERSELAPGDLVFFITDGRTVSHVGIYSGDGKFIHSASSGTQTGVIYSHLDEAYWRRTYTASGRALPWDDNAALAMAAIRGGPAPAVIGTDPPAHNSAVSFSSWGNGGFFAGFGAAWTWGGFYEVSLFRGISVTGTVGYKGSKYRAGLELRPEWDLALGITRFPVTLSFGNDFFQVFGGPAYTFGEPRFDLAKGTRFYRGGDSWLFELGILGALPLIKRGPGVFLFFGELAWQPYRPAEGEDNSPGPDFTANIRFSTGLRYLWVFR